MRWWCSSRWRWPGFSCCRRRSAAASPNFYLARLVRDSIAEISPFSPVGGMVAAARLMILKGMDAGYAAASVAADATTEAMAQVAFLAFGLGLGFTQFRHLQGGGPLTEAMMAVLLLAVPGIALLIFLQKRGAGFAERMAGRFFPQVKRRRLVPRRHRRALRLAGAGWRPRRPCICWPGSAPAAAPSSPSAWSAAQISLLNAMALEALLCTLRSIAAFVPAAIGVQEAGYAMLAPLFGLPAEMGAGGVAAQAGARDRAGRAGADLLAERREAARASCGREAASAMS